MGIAELSSIIMKYTLQKDFNCDKLSGQSRSQIEGEAGRVGAHLLESKSFVSSGYSGVTLFKKNPSVALEV